MPLVETTYVMELELLQLDVFYVQRIQHPSYFRIVLDCCEDMVEEDVSTAT